MNEQEIKAIVASHGYVARFVERNSTRGNGTSVVTVMAWRGTSGRSLGKLEEVQALSEAEIVHRLAKKFADTASAAKERHGSGEAARSAHASIFRRCL